MMSVLRHGLAPPFRRSTLVRLVLSVAMLVLVAAVWHRGRSSGLEVWAASHSFTPIPRPPPPPPPPIALAVTDDSSGVRSVTPLLPESPLFQLPFNLSSCRSVDLICGPRAL